MSTNKQALREAAEKAQEHGVFNMDIHSETVLALLDDLDGKDERIKELDSQRSLAFMACNRWRDKFVDAEAKLEAAEKRIAELEAREINLPPNELVTDTWTAPGDGWEVFDAQKVIDSIRSAGVRIAAGITVKGE